MGQTMIVASLELGKKGMSDVMKEAEYFFLFQSGTRC
jgi:hypothetical protein